MYNLITDKLEKEKIVNQFYFLLGGYIEDFMMKFLNKESFRLDLMAVFFKSDLDEEDDEEELQEIKDNQILLVSEYPASPTDAKAYYYYDEFYTYLKRYIEENYNEDTKLQGLLNEIKKENLINQYFFLIGGNIEVMLEKFLKMEAFGVDSMGILFKNDLDEEDDEEELQEIKNDQVLLVSEYPASPNDEKAYYYYDEFYTYLKRYIEENYNEDTKLQGLLKEIKAVFNL
ncbi:hypothetical protein ACWOFR_06410 [Carnobacterium gallinarum]|uniref:hypothetical protein n=1 Tax=Carnobacterium gallinarum TaxID=2749 RepID=UPI0005529BB7|nr:hypothetical protein [Carnobacterium gallinarum]